MFSEFILFSALKNHSWWGLGNHMGLWRSNLSWPFVPTQLSMALPLAFWIKPFLIIQFLHKLVPILLSNFILCHSYCIWIPYTVSSLASNRSQELFGQESQDSNFFTLALPFTIFMINEELNSSTFVTQNVDNSIICLKIIRLKNKLI